MALGWNEIKERAVKFSKEWEDTILIEMKSRGKNLERAYRPQPFINETKRIEFLFELYDKYTAGLFAKEKKNKTRK
jgi:hypothetical protein